MPRAGLKLQLPSYRGRRLPHETVSLGIRDSRGKAEVCPCFSLEPWDDGGNELVFPALSRNSAVPAPNSLADRMVGLWMRRLSRAQAAARS